MMTNANFIGNESANLVVIAHEYGGTTIQAVEESASEGSGIQYHVAQIRLNGSDVFNLITALVMRYNDLPDKAREGTRIELRRIVDLPAKSSEELPF